MLAQRARRLLPVLLAALVLSLAACSGGGDEGPARPVTAPIAATATATPTPIASSTPTPSPTATPAATPAPTESPLPSPTATPTPSPTSTATLTPTPTEPPTTFPYDTYDTTGAVAEPGSYAFLADPADTASAVTTYEGLRDGSATALRIHETDADGVSRAAFLDTVEVGDLFEWRAGRGLLRALHGDGGAAGPLGDASQAAWRRVDDLRLHGLQRRGLGECRRHGRLGRVAGPWWRQS